LLKLPDRPAGVGPGASPDDAAGVGDFAQLEEGVVPSIGAKYMIFGEIIKVIGGSV
jgi:hypothetical protein